ncbi:uncharacterized protein LJ206_015017 isoform 2-T2 [Theristicus caerulescens]
MSATIIPDRFSGCRKILQYWTLPVKPLLIAIRLFSLEQKGTACPSAQAARAHTPLPRSRRERAPAATGGFSRGPGRPRPGRARLLGPRRGRRGPVPPPGPGARGAPRPPAGRRRTSNRVYEYSPEEAGRKRLRSQQEGGGRFQGPENGMASSSLERKLS